MMPSVRRWWWALAPVLVWACAGGDGGSQGAGGRAAGAEAGGRGISAGRALEFVTAQVAFGPRVPGTEGHVAAGQWLDSILRARADTVIVQAFEHRTVEGRTLRLRNFFARFRPEDPTRVLFLSHWDTRPISDQARDASARRLPVPGANDGASGTAVLLALAELFDTVPPPIGVDLLLVDGEDYGDFGAERDVFLGSRHFVAHRPAGYRPLYGVLLDMVGDRELDLYIEGYSQQYAPEIVRRVWDLADRIGYGNVFHRSVRHTVKDDHVPLNEAKIQTINIIDFDYPYWHTPDDTPDKVSGESLRAVGDVLAALVYRGG
ncbi:MAG: M28 family peptidase [Gemmatimonadetes bacterium]|nr:M28 family peptidase [Gemmatimonadota bacterium]